MCHNLLHPRRGRDPDWNDIPWYSASVYPCRPGHTTWQSYVLIPLWHSLTHGCVISLHLILARYHQLRSRVFLVLYMTYRASHFRLICVLWQVSPLGVGRWSYFTDGIRRARPLSEIAI